MGVDERGPIFVDQRLTKALAHPTRVHILNLLYEKPNSPSKLAKKIPDTSLKLVSHHMKVLERLDCVELVREVEHGGRVEHIYRATRQPFFTANEWAEVEPKLRQPISVNILRLIAEDLGASLAAGIFDERLDNHLSRSPIRVDEEGWRSIVRILERALSEVSEVPIESAERARQSGHDLMKTTVVLMQFLVPPTPNEDDEEASS